VAPMGKFLPSGGKAFPPGSPSPGAAGGSAPGATLDRLASFRVTYVAVALFVVLYVFTVKAVEQVFVHTFRARVVAATRVDPSAGAVLDQIQSRVDAAVHRSFWVRVGGVRVTAIVLGADGQTIYAGGRRIPSPMPADPVTEAERLLPATVDVVVSVPHNSLVANAVLVVYAGLLIHALFLYDRRRQRLEQERLAAALAAREETALRAAQIEQELDALARELDERVETEVAGEMASVRAERARLQDKLDALARRESELRAQAGHLQETLESERAGLEEMLDEALSDLSRKDEELQSLQERLKRAGQAKEPAAPRARDVDLLAQRLRTLYKNLEFDDHAIQNLVALRDETMKLRAEEEVKRLSEDLETASVRRKVGGLPAHLTIFELGFAGKGRIYYTNGRQRRFRILAIGAKNSQKTDLEYLSRLPKE
jgi:signal transduction histidine kinase